MFLFSDRESVELISKLEDITAAKFALLGVPFDSTETKIPGQRFGPKELRKILNKSGANLSDIYDCGDIDVVFGNAKETLKRTEDTVRDILDRNPKIIPVLIGGEHTASFAPIKAISERHKNLQVISLDAHYDLYNAYIGEKWSHAAVMRRVFELGVDLKIIGIREKCDEAEKFYKKKKISGSPDAINPDAPTYISLDLDFFDPKIVPGVGDAEEKGFSFEDFRKIVAKCRNIVGFDIVEFDPMIEKDKTGEIAAKCFFELCSATIR